MKKKENSFIKEVMRVPNWAGTGLMANQLRASLELRGRYRWDNKTKQWKLDMTLPKKIKIAWSCPLYHQHKYQWTGSLCCKLQHYFSKFLKNKKKLKK